MESGVENHEGEGLNERELEILSLIAQGRSNREIGLQLSLSLNTIKWYNNRLFTKLGVRSRMQAVARAHELALLDEAASSQPPASASRRRVRIPRVVWLAGILALGVIAALVVVFASEQASLRLNGTPVKANDRWTPVIEEFEGVEMALVPAGCFMMGNPDGEPDALLVHEQCFEKPFWLDVTEVTNLQFGSSGLYPGGSNPRESVTWLEAFDHCESRGARLPSEAEWEYAARGPDGWAYPWGDVFDAENVVDRNFSGRRTASVASRPGGASWVGAVDMSGNVWEWTNSIYAPYPHDATDGREVSGAGDATSPRAVRGGAFNILAGYSDKFAATLRHRDYPDVGSRLVGFRCARDF